MFKFSKTLMIVLAIAFLVPQNVKAEQFDINDLIEMGKELDGKEVSIQGEVIGERMDRGDYSWININDGTNAIGIWIRKSEAVKLTNYGNYDYLGDTVRITGIFDRDCIEHGGEADIHSSEMVIIKKGYQVHEDISESKVAVTILLAVIAGALLLLYVRTNRKDRVVK